MAWSFRRLWATPPPWWEKWHLPELLLLLLFLLPVKACQLGWDYFAERRAAARVAAGLEPLNPWRRRVGLAPVTAALTDRFSSNDHIVHLVSDGRATQRRYGPYLLDKHVCYDADARRVLWEAENIALCPARCQARRRPAWVLKRTYTFTSAGQPILLAELTDGDSGRPLTRTQADSVLAHWKAQGARDSLAAERTP